MESLIGKFLLVLVFLVLVLSVGCTSIKTYEFGDISRIYCGTTNKEIRANIKATLSKKGVKIGVDYCSSAGLVDALLIQPVQQRH